MKNLFHISVTLALLGSLGCASFAEMKEQHKAMVCNEGGGYELGMNDAREGKPMNAMSLTQVCDPPATEAAMRGYRNGYKDGLASKREEVPETQINVNIGGGGDGGSSNKKYLCEVKAFTETFSAWGSSELEASEKAKKKCAKRYHEMHCDEVKCKH